MECSSTSPLLHVRGSVYVVSQFFHINESKAPREEPGDCLVMCMSCFYFCQVHLLFYTGISGRNPGTAGQISFMLFVCRKSPEFDSQNQSNVCHVKSSCDSTDARRNGSQEQREGRWETRKWPRGLGAGTYPAYLFFTNLVIFYVGNSVSRNSDCFK